MPQELTVRFRVDFGARCSIGIGKVELLERIGNAGSLSQAAREMHMSYRRAWLLLADLNLSFEEPVAVSSTGGRGGGGMLLTPFGRRLVSEYRQLEAAIQPLAAALLDEVGGLVKAPPTRGKKAFSVASIRRRQAPADAV
jgi:molybdate transport system regulatory protein